MAGYPTSTAAVSYDGGVTATRPKPSIGYQPNHVAGTPEVPGRMSLSRLTTTPARFRAWSIGLSLLAIISALLASIATAQFISATDKVQDNTGPVLISTQGLLASMAEADAANTAVFLSGEAGDRQQQRLYESALSRAPQQIEDIAAGIGDDEASHDSLKQIGSQLTEYARLTERARVNNLAGEASATTDLNAAIELVSGNNGMLDLAQAVTDRTQATLDDDIDAGLPVWIASLAMIVLTIVALLIAQRLLGRRTKRIINPLLLAATVCMALLGAWLLFAQFGRVVDLQTADDDAYDSIALTADLQTAAFEYKTAEAQAVIANDTLLLPLAADDDAIDDLLEALEAEADTAAESAAVSNLDRRWRRYLLTSLDVGVALDSGDTDAARTLAILSLIHI